MTYACAPCRWPAAAYRGPGAEGFTRGHGSGPGPGPGPRARAPGLGFLATATMTRDAEKDANSTRLFCPTLINDTPPTP